MTKPNCTEIVFVVDRSGSMSSIAADMKGGFDTFIEEQKKLPGECTVTLTQFDDRYDIVYQGMPIADVPPLNLVPRGWTALYDAVGRTINTTGERFASLPENERPSKVLFVIITDGEENRSAEFTREQVAEMIKTQRDVYSWEFIFLGANQDAFATAKGLGISIDRAATFDANAVGSAAVFSSLNSQSRSYRGGGGLESMQSVYDASKTT